MGEEVAGHPGQTGRAHHDRPLPWTDHPGCRQEGPAVTAPCPGLTPRGRLEALPSGALEPEPLLNRRQRLTPGVAVAPSVGHRSPGAQTDDPSPQTGQARCLDPSAVGPGVPKSQTLLSGCTQHSSVCGSS